MIRTTINDHRSHILLIEALCLYEARNGFAKDIKFVFIISYLKQSSPKQLKALQSSQYGQNVESAIIAWIYILTWVHKCRLCSHCANIYMNTFMIMFMMFMNISTYFRGQKTSFPYSKPTSMGKKLHTVTYFCSWTWLMWSLLRECSRNLNDTYVALRLRS